MDIQQLSHYLPSLTADQLEALERMAREWTLWNERINVVSRRDIDNLVERHILHSLALAWLIPNPQEGTAVMDLGCGGGFPGLPLAVAWPQARFLLVDRVAKKLRVAHAVAQAGNLQNVEFQHGDSGEVRRRFDLVVSRAVMPLPDLLKASAHCLKPGGRLICLKGGDLKPELDAVKSRKPLVVPLQDWLHGLDFFNEKFIIDIKL